MAFLFFSVETGSFKLILRFIIHIISSKQYATLCSVWEYLDYTNGKITEEHDGEKSQHLKKKNPVSDTLGTIRLGIVQHLTKTACCIFNGSPIAQSRV